MAAATQFTVQLENRPGTLADLLEALGNANVNVEGFSGSVCENRGTAQLVTDNPERAAQALDQAGLSYTKEDVLLLKVANQPGAGARIARALATEGVNLMGGYLAYDGRVVLQSDNPRNAEEVARRLGVW